MKDIIPCLLTFAVAIVTVTVLAFNGVYLTTLLWWVLFSELITYFGTCYVLKESKKD